MTIRTDADVVALWSTLVPEAELRRRSLWIVLLDEDGRTLPTVVPLHGLPARPDPAHCLSLASLLTRLTETTQARSALLLLTRPGSTVAAASDHHWAEALGAALGPELSPWPLHLATPGGVAGLVAERFPEAS